MEEPSGAKPARKADRAVDEASEDSFPASDPPSFTPGSGAGATADDTHAAGGPTGDRHATETAAGRQDGMEPPEHKTR